MTIRGFRTDEQGRSYGQDPIDGYWWACHRGGRGPWPLIEYHVDDDGKHTHTGRYARLDRGSPESVRDRSLRIERDDDGNPTSGRQQELEELGLVEIDNDEFVDLVLRDASDWIKQVHEEARARRG
jgi:hypothetical protein